MSTNITDFQQPDPDGDYSVRPPEKEVSPEDSIATCCSCNGPNTWCVPEQITGSAVSLDAGHTIAYWYTY